MLCAMRLIVSHLVLGLIIVNELYERIGFIRDNIFVFCLLMVIQYTVASVYSMQCLLTTI